MRKDTSDTLNQVSSDLDSQVRKSLRAAGQFYTQSSQGYRTFETGPGAGGVPLLVDGTPQWSTVMRDISNKIRLILWDYVPDNPPVQVMGLFDHKGNVILGSDKNGGVAEPWVYLPLYPQFAMAAGVYPYFSLAVASAATETIFWTGRIGKLHHPCISIGGLWGAAVGTNTTRYKLKAEGTTIATWDSTVLENSRKGPFQLQPTLALQQFGAEITLTAQVLSGTGQFAIQPLDCSLRQS